MSLVPLGLPMLRCTPRSFSSAFSPHRPFTRSPWKTSYVSWGSHFALLPNSSGPKHSVERPVGNKHYGRNRNAAGEHDHYSQETGADAAGHWWVRRPAGQLGLLRQEPFRAQRRPRSTAPLWKKLSPVELRVQAARLDQLVVPPTFHDATIVDYQDLIRVPYG